MGIRRFLGYVGLSILISLFAKDSSKNIKIPASISNPYCIYQTSGNLIELKENEDVV